MNTQKRPRPQTVEELRAQAQKNLAAAEAEKKAMQAEDRQRIRELTAELLAKQERKDKLEAERVEAGIRARADAVEADAKKVALFRYLVNGGQRDQFEEVWQEVKKQRDREALTAPITAAVPFK